MYNLTMLNKITKEIKKANKIALFHHVNPDGDSISSSYGLLLAIKSKFPNKQVVLVANRLEIAKLFPDWDIDPQHMITSIANSFITIVGDTALKSRVAHYEEYEKGYKKIVFDHHKMPDKPDFECDFYWREGAFPASAMQAFMIAKKLKVKFSEEVAFALMIGLVTDSGQFTFSANDARIVRMYAELIEHISQEKMVKFFNDSKRKTKDDLELTKALLDKLEYSKQVSYIIADKKFVKKYGRENIKAKLSVIGNIESFPIWAMILEKEIEDNGKKFDVSIRSNNQTISGVAKNYGGGGHDKAAACKLEAKDEIVKLIKELDDLK